MIASSLFICLTEIKAHLVVKGNNKAFAVKDIKSKNEEELVKDLFDFIIGNINEISGHKVHTMFAAKTLKPITLNWMKPLVGASVTFRNFWEGVNNDVVLSYIQKLKENTIGEHEGINEFLADILKNIENRIFTHENVVIDEQSCINIGNIKLEVGGKIAKKHLTLYYFFLMQDKAVYFQDLKDHREALLYIHYNIFALKKEQIEKSINALLKDMSVVMSDIRSFFRDKFAPGLAEQYCITNKDGNCYILLSKDKIIFESESAFCRTKDNIKNGLHSQILKET